MKTTIKFISLLAAVLCLTACEKNKEELRHERDIIYTVSEQTTTVHLATEAEWNALLDRFCDYAEGGSSVTFRNAKLVAKNVTKETVSYSTTDREEMKRWMAEMEDLGKTVTVTYDSQTGTWNGTAYARNPQPQPSGRLLTYECDEMPGFSYIWSFDTVDRRVYITLHDCRNYPQDGSRPDYPVGIYEYHHAEEVNTPFSYWLIDNWGDTAGLYNLEFVGSDTLHFNTTHFGYPATLVRTDSWQTYLCTDRGVDIVLHIVPFETSVYPTEYYGQLSFSNLDVECPLETGRFNLYRYDMFIVSGVCWRMKLDYSIYGGSVWDSLYIRGEPYEDNVFMIWGEWESPVSHTFTRAN